MNVEELPRVSLGETEALCVSLALLLDVREAFIVALALSETLTLGDPEELGVWVSLWVRDGLIEELGVAVTVVLTFED